MFTALVLKSLVFSVSFFLFGLISVTAQPISLIRYLSDTTSVVKQQMARLVSRPFAPEYDSVLKNISILLSYDTWSKTKPISYYTPEAEKADIYAHKAQSEWMLGFFKVSVLQEYLKMESGVLPLLQTSITHFDSTVVNYGKVNLYLVGQSRKINRIDSAFAKIVGDDLKEMYFRMEQEQNFEAARGFDIREKGLNLFEEVRHKYNQNDIEQSLTYWLVQSFARKDE